ncbi:hypothetical protein R50073_40550 [Maricurvus nonylphenolicus]|uniref:chemotaxis protein CheX n=1 Tax=Maricurvus nonylphenolicus TaxID=1008307 RepID=UPI0036F31FB7
MPSFLGTALIERGLLSESQLQQALDIQRQTNPLLGELAIEYGLLTSQQVEDINTIQRQINQRFGDIAQERALLNADQVQQLLDIQQSRSLRLGDILIREGFISQSALIDTLQSLQREAEKNYLFDQFNAAQQCALESLEKLFNRMMKSACKYTQIATLPQCLENYQYLMTITIVDATKQQSPFMRLSLACNDELLMNIASSFLGIASEDYDEDLALDALGELLNMTAGYIISDPSTGPNLAPIPATTTKDFQEVYLDDPKQLLAVTFDSQIGEGLTLISQPSL